MTRVIFLNLALVCVTIFGVSADLVLKVLLALGFPRALAPYLALSLCAVGWQQAFLTTPFFPVVGSSSSVVANVFDELNGTSFVCLVSAWAGT